MSLFCICKSNFLFYSPHTFYTSSSLLDIWMGSWLVWWKFFLRWKILPLLSKMSTDYINHYNFWDFWDLFQDFILSDFILSEDIQLWDVIIIWGFPYFFLHCRKRERETELEVEDTSKRVKEMEKQWDVSVIILLFSWLEILEIKGVSFRALSWWLHQDSVWALRIVVDLRGGKHTYEGLHPSSLCKGSWPRSIVSKGVSSPQLFFIPPA